MGKKIGLFGFGTVGQGTYQILTGNFPWPVEIAKICVKNPDKDRSLSKDHFTYRKEDILQDTSIELVVEAISDADEALIIVREALQAGKQVVTANKKMISENLSELLALQEQTGGLLRYEAAVCGAIPIIQTLDNYYSHEPILEVRGVFNGSTNYILSEMQRSSMAYETALKQAQEKGFAEADPFLDVSGQDARNKLIITALHAFGEILRPDDILISGIDKLPSFAGDLAKRENKRLKLVGRLRLKDDKLQASVLPELVSADDPLYHVEEENNLVLLQGAYSGAQSLSGKGAGALPTATAVVADIREVLTGKGYAYAKLKMKTNLLQAV